MKVPCVPHFEKLEQLARVAPGLDLDAVAACVPLLYLHRELDGALEQHYGGLRAVPRPLAAPHEL